MLNLFFFYRSLSTASAAADEVLVPQTPTNVKKGSLKVEEAYEEKPLVASTATATPLESPFLLHISTPKKVFSQNKKDKDMVKDKEYDKWRKYIISKSKFLKKLLSLVSTEVIT